MNALLAYNGIIEQFVKSTGLTKPEKNEEGGYTFVFGGKTTVDFTYDDKYDWFILKAKVGELSGQAQHGWFKRIAVANLMWRETQGATLSLEPRSGSVVLAIYHPIRGFDHVGLKRLLQRFLETAKRWQRLLRTDADNIGSAVELADDDPTKLLNRLI